jgi:LmbE family N-acetylglucosaminyl deacetylase
MAIFAHPDDIEFSCAGTLITWAKAGTKVCYLLLTSGDVGIAEPGMTRHKAAEIREAESRAAAAIAGAADIVFLREPDGLLQATLDLRKRIVREIRRFRPEVVLCGDPTVVWAGDQYINHPDHRAAALAAIEAVFPAAGQPNLFEELAEEGLNAHKVRKVYITSWEKADHVIDITDTIDLKIEALKAHKSQVGDWDPGPMIREWGADTAKDKGMDYAEGYRVVTLVSDEDWEKENRQD